MNNLEVFQPEFRLQQVSLQNFRGFEHLEFYFKSDLAVFIGENGAGKTSLLEGIAKLLIAFENQFRGEDSRDFKDLKTVFDFFDIRKGSVESINRMFLSFADHDLNCEIIFRKKSAPVLGQCNFEGLNEFVRLFYSYKPFNLPLLVYYPVSNAPVNYIDFEEASNDFEIDSFTALDGALDNSFDLIRFFSWYKWQQNIERQLGENKVLNVVRRVIYKMLSDEHNRFDKLSINWVKNPNGEMLIHKNDLCLNINQLSSGEKMLLALVADLARRLALANPYRENPLLGNGVVLIDEMDLHLHPRRQREVIPQLQETFPNCQFIVTTHSPLILSNLRRDNVIILEDFKTVKKTPHTFGRDNNSILYELMGVKQRPDDVQQQIDQVYELIDDGNKDEAQALLRELSEHLGENDIAIVKAYTHLAFF
ncbi:MAG: AAA family ATPase [Pseudomonadota bacterium]